MKQHNDNVGTVKDLVIHRIETAKSDIHSAEILLNAGELLEPVSQYCENKFASSKKDE